MALGAPFAISIVLLAFAVGPEFAFYVLAAVFALGVLSLIAAWVWARWVLPKPRKGVVAFFHPFSDGGGGGERVLWAAIQALQHERPDLALAIYCGEGSTPQQLCAHVAARFNLQVAPTFQVVPLPRRDLLLPERYPRLTMLGQAVGSVRVALEGLRQLVPQLYVDTTGWAFPYPFARAAGAKVAAYVHYPTISADMLERVREGVASYNNDEEIAADPLKTLAKRAYYHALAALYGAVGGCANVVMANSSWTRRHVAALWWRWRLPARVYPPCDTAALQALSLDRRLKRLYVVSVAQFRPEKDHPLQLRAFAEARRRVERSHDPAADAVLSARLQLVGSCRGAADEARVEELKALAAELGIADRVDFCVGLPFARLAALLGDAVVGLHTMQDEHFGISIVEYMAAGVVPIVHDSAGPKEDIVVPEPADSGGPGGAGEGGEDPQPTGYRCRTLDQYADALVKVLGMDQVARMRITAAARRRAQRFSDARFQSEFLACLEGVLPKAWPQ
eukprot:scaffold3.g6278.t1